MSYKKSINDFILKLEKLRKYGGTDNELSIRSAFKRLINIYAKSKSLILIEELDYSTKYGTVVSPDGTLKDSIRLSWGYWESKDLKDDIEKEIQKKIKKGYPTSNIIFENSEIVVLYQNNEELFRCSITETEKLDNLMKKFISYQPKEIREFHKAIERFKVELPKILEVLRDNINDNKNSNPKLKKSLERFLQRCKDIINPSMVIEDIQEMMIQHLLTQDIFIAIFEEDKFHRENNIAKELQRLVEEFFPRFERKNLIKDIEEYYKVIKKTAANVVNHKEKQQFLKVLYENFYQAYNPKAADLLGIFYTSNEIVDFMVEGTEYLLDKHFNKLLCEDNVEILDPATGTGTFITEIIDKIPKSKLKKKYQDEIHCNEIAILPYYIANLNIENTYFNKMDKEEYLEFKNICFIDTLENLGFKSKDKQMRLFDLGDENLDRIKNQNKKKISVIIGNPPYNANQLNFNEANKNRAYPDIDKMIKSTYVKLSSATKTKVYDMYTRFLRWASIRISKNGILSFVSNNSFIDAVSYDGFRISIAKEFNEMWVINLKGNARTKGERRKKEGGNIFEDKIKVGIAIYFLIKNEQKDGNFNLYYYEIDDYANFEDKNIFLIENSLESLKDNFRRITPTKNGKWINQSESDFESFIKLAKRNYNDKENTIFILKFPGINTARDSWVYDFDSNNLKDKVKYFVKKYDETLKKIKNKKIKNDQIEQHLDFSIKWSRDLKNKLKRHLEIDFDELKITDISYRPFIIKKYYYDKPLSDVLTRNHFMTFGEELKKENITLVFSIRGTSNVFNIFCSKRPIDYHFIGDTHILPLYYYEKKNKISNISDWALQKFREKYPEEELTKRKILNYVYGVLNNPDYIEKYAKDLKRDYPRIPFYDDFEKWQKIGKQLLELHLDIEDVEPYEEIEIEELEEIEGDFNPKILLKWDKKANIIFIDELTQLKGIPKKAQQYKISGKDTFIDYILKYYSQTSYKSTIIGKKKVDGVESFNSYNFKDYKHIIIELIQKAIAVSLKTIDIIESM